MDQNLNVTWWNEHIAELTGFSKGAAMGENLVDKFIDKDSQTAVRDVLTRALVHGENTENYELPLYT